MNEFSLFGASQPDLRPALPAGKRESRSERQSQFDEKTLGIPGGCSKKYTQTKLLLHTIAKNIS
jgi:hypothetical protein